MNQLWSFGTALEAPGSQEETSCHQLAQVGFMFEEQDIDSRPDGGGGLEPQSKGFQEDALGAALLNNPILIRLDRIWRNFGEGYMN